MTFSSRAQLVVLDQLVSGASNALPLLVVVRYSSAEDFAAVALLHAPIPFVLMLGRSLLGEAVLGSLWTAPQIQRGLTIVSMLGLSTGAIAALAYLASGGLVYVGIVAMVVVPTVVLQDFIRHYHLAAGRPIAALASDACWLVAATLVQTSIIWLSESPKSGNLYLGYLGAALAAAGFGLLTVRHEIRGRRAYERCRLPKGTLLLGVSNTIGVATVFALPYWAVALVGSRSLGYWQSGQLLALPMSLVASTLPALLLPRPWLFIHPIKLCLKMIVVASAGACLLFLVGSPFLGVALPRMAEQPLRLAFAACALQGALAVVSATTYLIIRRAARERLYSSLRLTWVLTVLGVSAVTGPQFGLAGLLSALVVSSLVELLIGLVIVWRLVGPASTTDRRSRRSRQPLRRGRL